jgi:hypothetical protein
MNKFALLIFITLFGFVYSNAQYNKEFGSTDECYGKTFTLVAWVLTDTTNEYSPLTESQVASAIETVNSKFSGICVDFKLCEFNVLPNHRQDKLTKGVHDEEIAALYRKKNVINLYFAKEIENKDPTPGPCGYAPMGSILTPSDTNLRDAIFFQKDCFSSGVLAHELGHYFGLYHTFETTAFGAESADGSNCSTTGDLVCDTQADPKGSIDSECHLDPEPVDLVPGLYYEPPVCNIMSYYNPTCDQFFTRGQLDRMLMIMKTGRSYLW